MIRTRGRSSASSRIIARARATAGVGMTATSLPSLNRSSLSATSSSNSAGGITSGGVDSPVTTSRSNSVSSLPVTLPGNRQNASSDDTINSVHELCKGILNKINGFDHRLKEMEDKQLKLSDAIKELHDMMKKMSKESFIIKGTPYETPLKGEIGKLFCHSLERKPDDKDLQVAIVKVLGREARDKHKFDIALKYCKSKLTDFRTEERRKVLGLNPYSTACLMNTSDLSTQIMKQMCVADDTDADLYIRHLALLRKFVREVDEDCAINYGTFRVWINSNFNEISEETWARLLSEDEEYAYHVQSEALISSERVVIDPYVDNSLGEIEIQSGTGEE